MEVEGIDKETHAFSQVLRGVEDTVASSHSLGAVVHNRITAGTLNELATEADVDDAVLLALIIGG